MNEHASESVLVVAGEAGRRRGGRAPLAHRHFHHRTLTIRTD